MNSFINSLSRKPGGIFILVDDNLDEHLLFKIALQDTGLDNEVVCFSNGEDALSYLKETKDPIFMILCDLNMPKMDGLELKRMIELTPELKTKAIPFIFHSNGGSHPEIKAAYFLNIQGYIRKAANVEGTVKSLMKIVAVWTEFVHPKDLQ